MIEPWDRQEEESDTAWRGFLAYRDMAVPRSTLAVAAALGASPQTVSGWARAHGWTGRSVAWDRELDRHRRAEMLAASARMGERHARSAEALQQALMLPAMRFLERIQSEIAQGRDAFESWDLRELQRAAETASRLWVNVAQFERLARGMSTVNVGGSDGGAIRLEHSRDMEGRSRQELESYLLGFEDGNAQEIIEAATPSTSP